MELARFHGTLRPLVIVLQPEASFMNLGTRWNEGVTTFGQNVPP